MKHKYLLLALSLVSTTVRGQIKFGPEAGLNLGFMKERREISGLSKTQNSHLSPGFKAGIISDIKITNHVYVQAGAFYVWDNVKFSQEVDFSTYNLSNPAATTRYTISTVRVPVYALYKSNLESMGRFICGIGPYFSYNIGAYQRTELPILDSSGATMTYGWKKEDFELSIGDRPNRDHVKSIDYGVNAMLGYESNVGLFFRGDYHFSLNNMIPGSPERFFRRNWGIGLTIGVLLGKDNW